MSRIRANNIVNGAGTGAPTFPNGAVINGISTITADVTLNTAQLNGTDSNFSGIGTYGVVSLGTGTSISSPSSNVLTLGTNDNERIRITSTGAVGIGTTNPAGQFEISASGSGTINSLVKLVDDSVGTGPIISMERRRATNADNDNIGGFYLHGYNDNANPERIGYGAITGVIDDATDGSEKGSVRVNARFDGSFEPVMEFHGNGRHILPYGSANYSIYVRSVSVANGATEDLFDLYQEANSDGVGLYMVTVMRMTASTGTRATNIIGLVGSSTAIVYSTLDSNNATLSVSGTTVRVTNNGTSTFDFAAMATPLLINGRT